MYIYNINNPLPSDIQYADIDDALDWRGVQLRRYRKSLEFTRAAVARWKQEKIEFVVQLGDIIDGKVGQQRRERWSSR